MAMTTTIFSKRFIRTIALIVASIAVYLLSQFRTSWSIFLVDQSAIDIAPDCVCIDDPTAIAYDFCYSPPFNRSIRGRRFSCEWTSILRDLELLNPMQSSRSIDRRNIDARKVVFVTASSESHYESVLVLIQSLHRFAGNIVFYDLGLNEEHAEEIRRIRRLEYRSFDFKKFPRWIERLYEFRWKPLVIAEALKEFESVWYFDTSLKLESGNFTMVYEEMAKCGSYDSESWKMDVGDSNLASRRSSSDNGQRCEEKSPYLLHAPTGHGIFPTTHPDLYNFFPTDLDRLKNRTCQMFEAGLVFVVRNEESRNLLKWYVLCALERDCMGPRAAVGSCEFNAVDRYAKFAKCHRFDQSTINLLLANTYDFDSRRWSSGVRGFFGIDRRQRLDDGGFLSGSSITLSAGGSVSTFGTSAIRSARFG